MEPRTRRAQASNCPPMDHAHRCAVTVITALYNCERHLVECANSVQKQSLLPREHIIVDDRSTDSSYALALRLASECTAVPIRVLRMPRNTGPSAARNTAIANATGEFVAVLDDDDVALPDWLSTVVPPMVMDSSIGAIGGGTIVIAENGECTGKTEHCVTGGDRTSATQQYVNFPITHSGSLLRKADLERIGCYQEGLRASEDCDLFIGLAFEARIHHVGVPLVYRRRRRDSASLRSAPYARALRQYFSEKRRLLRAGAAAAEVSAQLQGMLDAIQELPCKAQTRPGRYEYVIGMSFFHGGRAEAARHHLAQAARLGYHPARAKLVGTLARTPCGSRLGVLAYDGLAKWTAARVWGRTNIARLAHR